MTQNILVTYASQYGATAEIAEKIGELLPEEGLQADVTQVDSVSDLSPYQAVILGSGVYIDQWNKKAATFLKAHEKSLAERPVWLFSSGRRRPSGDGERRADPIRPSAGYGPHPPQRHGSLSWLYQPEQGQLPPEMGDQKYGESALL